MASSSNNNNKQLSHQESKPAGNRDTFKLDPCTELWASSLRSDKQPDFFGNSRYQKPTAASNNRNNQQPERPKTAPSRTMSNMQMQNLTARLLKPTIATKSKHRPKTPEELNSNSYSQESNHAQNKPKSAMAKRSNYKKTTPKSFSSAKVAATTANKPQTITETPKVVHKKAKGWILDEI